MEGDFIVIQMPEAQMPEAQTAQNLIDNAYKFININESFINRIMNHYYYIVSQLFLLLGLVIYFKNIEISGGFINYKDLSWNIKSKNKLVILDSGIYVCSNFVRYESIIKIGIHSNNLILTIFGSVENHNKFIRIKNNNLSYTVLLKINKPLQVFNIIKSNMFYHIKYNQVDKKIVEYYINKKIE